MCGCSSLSVLAFLDIIQIWYSSLGSHRKAWVLDIHNAVHGTYRFHLLSLNFRKFTKTIHNPECLQELIKVNLAVVIQVNAPCYVRYLVQRTAHILLLYKELNHFLKFFHWNLTYNDTLQYMRFIFFKFSKFCNLII